MMPIVDRNSPYDLEKSPHNHVQGQRRPDSRMEFTPCPVFHQPQQPRLPQDFFVQQHHQQQHDYQYQTVQYCLTTQQYNLVQQDTPVQQHHQQQQHHPQVAVYQQQQQPSPLALSGATTVGQQNNVDSPGQSSVDSGFCAAAPSASLQTPAYYASSDVVLGASSLEGTEVGGGLSKQHRNSQHPQSANNPQGEKQQQQEQQEDDLDRLLELAVSSENSTAIR